MTYEKPVAKIVDFAAEEILNGGMGEGFGSMLEGNEDA